MKNICPTIRSAAPFSKKNKQEDDDEEEQSEDPELSKQTEEEEEKLRKRKRIPNFVHSLFEDDEIEEEEDDEKEDGEDVEREKKEYGKFMRWFLSIFFEGEEFEYARPWAMRVRTVLQLFIRLVQGVYLLFFILILVAVFFPMPRFMYDLLINILRFRDWYVYPFVSLIFLQEICNIFDTDTREPELEETKRQRKRNESSALKFSKNMQSVAMN